VSTQPIRDGTPHTARTLQAWLREVSNGNHAVVFPNAHGGVLSRGGVDYLLRRAMHRARTTCPSFRQKKVSPHLIRHLTAMHLLQAGVDIAVLALWLGHESIETTHSYLETALALKEQALQKLAPLAGSAARFTVKDLLLHFSSRRCNHGLSAVGVHFLRQEKMAI
jgi:integrase/recombinase XerD